MPKMSLQIVKKDTHGSQTTIVVEGDTDHEVDSREARELATSAYGRMGGLGALNPPYAVTCDGDPLFKPGQPPPAEFPKDAKFRKDYLFNDRI
jgi:hypothetical protein